jgi:hypothetical protein
MTLDDRRVKMGIYNKLFGSKPQNDPLPPKVTKGFQRIESFLNDEAAQNNMMPEQARDLIAGGASCDEIPGGSGEFGRDPTNPIPVNGPIGETIYLSRLVTSSGQKLFGHRIGTLERVDVYETVSFDGATWDVFFLDYYHPRKSRKIPAGYRLASRDEGGLFVTIVNMQVSDFPLQMDRHIVQYMKGLIGVPLRPPRIHEIFRPGRFVRPTLHAAKLRRLTKIGMFDAPFSSPPN